MTYPRFLLKSLSVGGAALVAALMLAYAPQAAHAESVLSPGCEAFNAASLDGDYASNGSDASLEFFAGDTITLSASASPIYLAIPANDNNPVESASPLVYVVPQDMKVHGFAFGTSSGETATWTVSCNWGT